MDLTKKDRVVLINQYRILALLKPDDASHYEELIEILDHGYEIFYSVLDQWISDDMPNDEGRLVLDILGLYRCIENYKRKTKNKKVISHRYGYFHGFDGNNETAFMSFSRFLIIKQGKFSEQEPYLRENDSCNSHSPKLDKYMRMIAKWKEADQEYDLSEEQILEILEA
jgi:hypothetical protein